MYDYYKIRKLLFYFWATFCYIFRIRVTLNKPMGCVLDALSSHVNESYNFFNVSHENGVLPLCIVDNNYSNFSYLLVSCFLYCDILLD